jgi:glycine betaine/choline ABC-type transport system substrate-binding protein
VDRRLFLAGSLALIATGCSRRRDQIVVGSKNFTEQLILGEILAQYLGNACSAPTDGRFYMGGTYICHQALLAGRIDTYVEYTGTAVAAVLKEKFSNNRSQVFEQMKMGYKQRFNLDVMPPLGFNNSFAMIVRGEDAKRMGITKISELARYAPEMVLGVGYEFLERADGFQGLARTYELKFRKAPVVMDLGLLYNALEHKSVDIIAGNNTDGLIEALGLVVLEDDRSYFPPYDAVPVARPELLQRFPGAQPAFVALGGKISADEMRKMNYDVDGRRLDAGAVAKQFLLQGTLLTIKSITGSNRRNRMTGNDL